MRPRLAFAFLRTRAPGYRQLLLDRTRAASPPAAAPGGTAGERIAVLLHVAVDAGERSDGAGRALVDAFVDLATRAGAARALLVTRDDADGAAGFYERLGWRHTDTRTDRDGHVVREYTLTLERW